MATNPRNGSTWPTTRGIPRLPTRLVSMEPEEYAKYLRENNWSDHAIEEEVARLAAWQTNKGLIKPAPVMVEPASTAERAIKEFKQQKRDQKK